MWNDFQTSSGMVISSTAAERIFGNLQPYFDELDSERGRCPEEETLLDMVLEPHSVPEHARLHVEKCKPCQQTTAILWQAYEAALDYQEYAENAHEIVPPAAHDRVFAATSKLYREQFSTDKTCPQRYQLLRMLAGDNHSGELRQHVTQCAQCRQFLSKAIGICLLAGATDWFLGDVIDLPAADAAKRVWESLQPCFFSQTTQQSDECPSRERLVHHHSVPEESPQVGVHVKECEHCQRQNSELRETLELAAHLDAFQSDVYGPDDIPTDAEARLRLTVTDQFRHELGIEKLKVPAILSPDRRSIGLADATKKTGIASILRAIVPYASAACLLIALNILVFGNGQRELKSTAFNQGSNLAPAMKTPEENSQAGIEGIDNQISKIRQKLLEIGNEYRLAITARNFPHQRNKNAQKGLEKQIEILESIRRKLADHEYAEATQLVDETTELDADCKSQLYLAIFKASKADEFELLVKAYQGFGVDEAIGSMWGQLVEASKKDPALNAWLFGTGSCKRNPEELINLLVKYLNQSVPTDREAQPPLPSDDERS
jgi:hypothetical protein